MQTEMSLMKTERLLPWLRQELQSINGTKNGLKPLFVPTNQGGVLISQNSQELEVVFAADGEKVVKTNLCPTEILTLVEGLVENDVSQPWSVNPVFISQEKVCLTLPWFQLSVETTEARWSLLTPTNEFIGSSYLGGPVEQRLGLNFFVFDNGSLAKTWVVIVAVDLPYRQNTDILVRTGTEGYRGFHYGSIHSKGLLCRQPPFGSFQELLRFLWARQDEAFDPANLFVSGDVGFYFVGATADEISDWFEKRAKTINPTKPARVNRRHQIQGFSAPLSKLRLMKAGTTINHPDHPSVVLPQTGFYDCRTARGYNFADLND